MLLCSTADRTGNLRQDRPKLVLLSFTAVNEVDLVITDAAANTEIVERLASAGLMSSSLVGAPRATEVLSQHHDAPAALCVGFGIQTGLASGRAGALARRRVRAGRSFAAEVWWG